MLRMQLWVYNPLSQKDHRTRLHLLHLQLLGVLPSSLISKHRREVSHAGQCVWVLLPKHRLSRPHHLDAQLLGPPFYRP